MSGTVVAASGVLIDSDVLIWFARGNARALVALRSRADRYISAVSYMEMVQVCRNKAELKVLQKAFKPRVEYDFTNPSNGQVQTKMSYVQAVDDLYVGCGVYKTLLKAG